MIFTIFSDLDAPKGYSKIIIVKLLEKTYAITTEVNEEFIFEEWLEEKGIKTNKIRNIKYKEYYEYSNTKNKLEKLRKLEGKNVLVKLIDPTQEIIEYRGTLERKDHGRWVIKEKGQYLKWFSVASLFTITEVESKVESKPKYDPDFEKLLTEEQNRKLLNTWKMPSSIVDYHNQINMSSNMKWIWPNLENLKSLSKREDLKLILRNKSIKENKKIYGEPISYSLIKELKILETLRNHILDPNFQSSQDERLDNVDTIFSDNNTTLESLKATADRIKKELGCKTDPLQRYLKATEDQIQSILNETIGEMITPELLLRIKKDVWQKTRCSIKFIITKNNPTAIIYEFKFIPILKNIDKDIQEINKQIKVKYINNTKGENKMEMRKKEEGLEVAIYEIECPGINKDNAKVVTDSENNEVIIQHKDGEEVESKCIISVKERYEIKKTSIKMEHGIITVNIPTKEGVITNIEIE